MSVTGDTLSSENQHLIWLAAFGVAMMLVAVGALCWVFRSGRIRRVPWAIWSVASLLPAALCFSDLCSRLDLLVSGPLALLCKGGLLATVPLACYFAAVSRARETALGGATHRVSWSLIGVNAVAAVWASGCFYQAVMPVDSPLPEAPVNWQIVAAAKGITDTGSAIGLMTSDEPPSESTLTSLFGQRFRDRVIELAPINRQCNCHGWVFTGGKYAIKGELVDTILLDNQYLPVEEPIAGDLIIYRDAQGHVLHSGIVRLAEQDLVMVESKWGAYPRYLHQAADQPYSQQFEYYRSDRPGHLITFEEDTGPMLTDASSVPSQLAAADPAPYEALEAPAPRVVAN
jgi:hypothetical protein